MGRSTTETHRSAMNKMITKKNTTPRKTGTVRQGGVGYKKFEGRPLYLPDIEPPAWLDGSMVGDRGFDPLGLSKPTEFIQMGNAGGMMVAFPPLLAETGRRI